MKLAQILIVVLLLVAVAMAFDDLPLASGAHRNLPNENCVCICHKGGYQEWLKDRIETMNKLVFGPYLRGFGGKAVTEAA